MVKEDKKLLLKDLCARLPYGVIVNTPKGDGHLCSINQTIFGNEYGVNIKATERDYFNDDECDIKPYLRSMSSMSEREEEDWGWMNPIPDGAYPICERLEMFYWLNAHHFDYRGLIEKGLALEAPKDMYNFKELI